MKSKLVIRGHHGEEKSLLALSLRTDDSKVDIYAFPEEIVTEDFARQMDNEWKSGVDVTFPEGVRHFEIELSASGELLPDNITTENKDLLNRAKTEWLFAVLSGKLSNTYNSELTGIKDKIEQTDKFEQSLWNELKEFWDKVQTQIREKNLFSEHIDLLRSNTNALFDLLKEKRKELDKQFQSSSSTVKEEFVSQLKEIDEKVSKGLSLQPLFEELKQLQSKFRNAMMTNSDKKNVWDKLDAAFKIIKEKRFGGKGESESPSSSKARLENRYAGLLNAITKMEKSIQFDQKDLDFQTSRINDPGGQLEVQIRQAKLIMIQDRITSKQTKLADMVKTKSELESKRDRFEKQEASRKEKEEARKLAEERIASEIKAASASRTEQSDVLEKAAKQISESKSAPVPPKESILGTIGSMVSESLEDAIDTVKAVSSVMSDRIGDVIEDTVDKIKGHTSEGNDENKPSEEVVSPQSDDAANIITDESSENAIPAVEPVVTDDLDGAATSDTDVVADVESTEAPEPAKEVAPVAEVSNIDSEVRKVDSPDQSNEDSHETTSPDETEVTAPLDKFSDEVANDSNEEKPQDEGPENESK